MKNLNRKHYLIIGIWFVINLLQSIFTGLHSDESYYWMYSQNLDWGFFDHPPMAALFIFLGHSVLPGEIGVRILMILFSTLTLAIILNEINEKKDYWFLAIFVFSFPLMHTHIAGFLAIPDIPLLFFVLLFLICYKKFIENPGWLISIALAIIIASMIYSKYHAFLIIGFTVLSNLKLFKSKYFYGTIILTNLLLIPHALWQVENDFPTFTYHLIERAKPFQFKYVLPYLLSVLAMAGPLTGILVFWKLRKAEIKTLFQRALLFNIIGFIVLFFLMSFKNRIEAHWVAAIIPMLMFLSYPLISGDFKTKLWFKRLALPFVFLFILYRIYLILDVVPNVGNLKMTFYNRKAHAFEIKEKADGKKVAFFNNYAAISNYIFYTGDSAVHLATPEYRFNQYDLWDEESYAEGEKLFAVQSKHLNPPNLSKMATGQLKGFVIIEEFQSLNDLKINLDSISHNIEEYQFYITLSNNSKNIIYSKHVSVPTLVIKQDTNLISEHQLHLLSQSNKFEPGESSGVQVPVKVTLLNNYSPVVIYTRSKENIRGEIKSFKIKDFLK